MDRMLKAIDKSIEHWEENVEKAHDGTLVKDDVRSEKCALCDLSARRWLLMNICLNTCDHCALSWFGFCCNDCGSIWREYYSIPYGDNEATIRYAELMLQSLILVRLAYVDFFGEV